jgi:hypothetical protein
MVVKLGFWRIFAMPSCIAQMNRHGMDVCREKAEYEKRYC